MEIVLVRHGQPHWEPDGIADDDPDLTELGRRQAVRVAEALNHEKFDVIYASPVKRARQTVGPIASRLGMEVEFQSWMRELELPSLSGKTRDEVEEYFRHARARDLESQHEGFEGGESFRHFSERVVAGLEGTLLDGHRLLVHEDAGHRLWREPESIERLLFVAHEGTNSLMISHLLGLELLPWSFMKFSSAWAGITRLHLTRIAGSSVWSMETFNDVSHLEGLGNAEYGRTPRL